MDELFDLGPTLETIESSIIQKTVAKTEGSGLLDMKTMAALYHQEDKKEVEEFHPPVIPLDAQPILMQPTQVTNNTALICVLSIIAAALFTADVALVVHYFF